MHRSQIHNPPVHQARLCRIHPLRQKDGRIQESQFPQARRNGRPLRDQPGQANRRRRQGQTSRRPQSGRGVEKVPQPWRNREGSVRRLLRRRKKGRLPRARRSAQVPAEGRPEKGRQGIQGAAIIQIFEITV